MAGRGLGLKKPRALPTRYLILGPDRSANFLALIVLDRPQGPGIIHAMTMTEQYRQLLPGGPT